MILRTDGFKSLDISYVNSGLLSAYTRCRADGDGNLQIISLFSTKDYAGCYYEEMLLDEVLNYALAHNLHSIYYIVGPEPWNPEPHLSLAEVEQWYLKQGFEKTTSVLGAAKMVLTLPEL